MIYLGMFIGSTIGGMIPMMWGIAGIVVAYKLTAG
jgi:hypothetical protein